jgi:hypothetical protein
MPYTTSVAGTTITASWANANVRDQAVTPFASTTARDSAITAPVAGMVCVTTDTSTVWTYSGTAWVQSAQNGAWTTWTPVITQSGTVTATIQRASYARYGRTIVASFRVSITGTGTAANQVSFAPPVNSAYGADIVGYGLIFDTSAGLSYTGSFAMDGVANRVVIAAAGVGVSPVQLGATGSGFTAALAAGDVVTGYMTYEAAS